MDDEPRNSLVDRTHLWPSRHTAPISSESALSCSTTVGAEQGGSQENKQEV
jgi:hypothetical protein